MKNLKSILLAAVFAIVAISCSDNDDTPLQSVEAKTVSNLHAPQESDYTVSPPAVSGAFTKFSFKTGGEVMGDDWDLAFRGLKIIVNGGSKYNPTDTDEPIRTGNASIGIVKTIFSEMDMISNDEVFKQDAENSYGLNETGDSWYTYDRSTHIVTANAGTVIVVKTIDGNYAKMEVLSYYKDNPETPTSSDEARYYTFNYVYNPNIGDKNFQ